MNKLFSFKINDELYEMLRKSAFETKRPMSEILREALQDTLEDVEDDT